MSLTGSKSSSETQAAPPAVAPLPEPPPPPPPPPLPDIKDLVGLTAADLTKYFGDPAVRRHEGPAEVWHYVGPECVLHLFLYSDGKGGVPVVDHVEISERGPLLVEAAERRNGVCIQAFLKPNMTLPIQSAPSPAVTDDAGASAAPAPDADTAPTPVPATPPADPAN
jgi:hypothetical protein